MPPNYWTIPAGQAPIACKACGTPVYFVRTGAGGKMPISATCEGGVHPTTKEPGRGIVHFANCSDPDRFRRPKRAA